MASCGGRCSLGVGRVFLKRPDVFKLCDKAVLLLVFIHIYIYVYSGVLCDYEIYLSLSVYCSDLTHCASGE